MKVKYDSILRTVRENDTLSSKSIDITGLPVNDLPVMSSEFLLSTGWTSTDWTGDFATGWTHTTGNTTALSQSKVAVNATKYQITYTVTNRTAGSFSIAFGGVTISAITASGASGPTSTSTASLVVTPTTDFDGTVVISIKSLTAESTATMILRSSDGTVRLAARANTATDGTFIGSMAGAFNTTGTYNTFAGASAGRSNTTGSYNTFAGAGAGYSNTTGASNTFAGRDAGRSNTTGANNTFAGRDVGRSNTTGANNTFAGVSAGYSNTTGASNTFAGAGAGYSNTTGASNTFAGRDAGRYITGGVTGRTTGNNGLYLGYLTKASADGTDNEIVIGYNATGSGSNTITLGDTTITNTYLRGQVQIATGITMAEAANITLGTTTGTKIGATASGKLGFWGVTPVVQPVFATGASHTVDELITMLQTIGICKQS